MVKLAPNKVLVQSAAELPDASGVRELFLDVETTSFVDGDKALNPYKGHRIAGVCVTWDENPTAYYIPMRHRDAQWNIDLDAALRWLRDTVSTCHDWVNHNVKFDAHFAAVDEAEFTGRLVDTMTASKVLDADRLYKGGYGLDKLSAAWLEEDISRYEDKLKEFLAGVKLPRNKNANDYGLVPADIMGTYGCQDVLTTRALYRHLQRRMPEECHGVWDTEIKLTPVLYDIEREGLRVDRQQLEIAELKTVAKLARIEELIHEEVGFSVTPSSSDDCFDLLCNHYGLPVLVWSDKGNPSFDKEALVQYSNHPDIVSDPQRAKVVKRLQTYRKAHTLLTFFIQPYLEHEVDGIMHPDYNQAVRSGRLSCRRPNAQQLSKEAKELVVPGDGEAFLSCDYSQIEFRIIVHYIKDVVAIKAYNEDPNTDFHTWVAEMCGIPRRPAKNVNFAIGFGAGKNRVTSMLAGVMELMTDVVTRMNDLIESGKVEPSKRSQLFDALCTERANEVYQSYHRALPGLRPTSRRASSRIKSRGYVRNAYDRHLHLDPKAAHIAFNRLIQSTAADVMKERTVAVAPRYNSEIRDLGLRISASVHDETLFVGPRDVTYDQRVVKKITGILENVAAEFRVPITTSAGWSDINWRIASSDEGELAWTD